MSALFAVWELMGSESLFAPTALIAGKMPALPGKASTVADKNDRVKENVAGAYYVDTSCIDCDVCRDTAPENFIRSDENSYSFVSKQPETEEERAACEEALSCCPVEAIGNDGSN